MTVVGSVQWELIQPLDDRASTRSSLRRRGKVSTTSRSAWRTSRQTIDAVQAKGRRVLQSGFYKGATFAYLSTDEDLGVITEIYDWPADLPEQEPDAVYP